jgi:isopentenyl diphosphate isomerase/L-lactate dehydrogenase-like FMN-dependent dehydrogenase
MKALQQEQNDGTATDNVLHVQDPEGVPASVLKSMKEYDDNLSSARDAISVFDLEAVARKKLNVGHLAWLLGAEDGSGYMANRRGFSRFQLRPKRLVDVRKIDTSVRLFGTKWNTPIILCPVGAQAAFNPEAELATARAAKAKGHLQMLSDAPFRSIEDITAARGEALWAQVPWKSDWSLTLGRIKRAEAAGCPAIFLTVDNPAGNKREAVARVWRENAALCATCHTLADNGGPPRPRWAGPSFTNVEGALADTKPVGPPVMAPPQTWDWVKKVRDATSRKLLIKGIQTREDAELAIQHGVDGVHVSNHGGRVEMTGRGTIECLSEVVAGVAGRVPVIIDGGFRRGTDIYKALAMGATAIGVGRPYLWGLASFGQEGVEAALDILSTEFRMIMGQMGATSIKGINANSVIRRAF